MVAFIPAGQDGPPQLVLETPGRQGTLTTTPGDPEKEVPSNVLKVREKKLKSDTSTESLEFQNSEHVER